MAPTVPVTTSSCARSRAPSTAARVSERIKEVRTRRVIVSPEGCIGCCRRWRDALSSFEYNCREMIAVVVLALSALAVVPASAAAQTPAKTPLRVFVQTDEVGGDLTGRRTSVTDLAAVLATKKKVFLVVDAEENADVIVDILDRTVD